MSYKTILFPVLSFQLTVEVFDYMDRELRLAESGEYAYILMSNPLPAVSFDRNSFKILVMPELPYTYLFTSINKPVLI